MIVDASVAIDAVADSGQRGRVARDALRAIPATEPVLAPGHFAVEVMAALRYLATSQSSWVTLGHVPELLDRVASFEIPVEATSWSDVRRAWQLSQALRYTDAVYVAAAERHRTKLLTADRKLAASGARARCQIVTL